MSSLLNFALQIRQIEQGIADLVLVVDHQRREGKMEASDAAAVDGKCQYAEQDDVGDLCLLSEGLWGRQFCDRCIGGDEMRVRVPAERNELRSI